MPSVPNADTMAIVSFCQELQVALLQLYLNGRKVVISPHVNLTDLLQADNAAWAGWECVVSVNVVPTPTPTK